MPQQENEPMIRLERNGVAPILSYNVPEPTSYSGRNFIDLQLGDSYFKPEPVSPSQLTVSSHMIGSLESAVMDAANSSVQDSSLESGLAGSASAPLFSALKVLDIKLSQKLANLDLNEVRAMARIGKRLNIYKSLFGTLTYKYVHEPVIEVSSTETALEIASRIDAEPVPLLPIEPGEPPEPVQINVMIGSPAAGATVTGPHTGAPVRITGTSEIISGIGLMRRVEVKIGSGAFLVATPAAAGNWTNWSFDTVASASGPFTVTARATHSSGVISTHTITFQIALALPPDTIAPGLAITSPVNAQEFPAPPAGSATVAIVGTASDVQSGVRLVEVKVDSGNFVAAIAGSPDWSTWSKSITVAGVGVHVITARCTDNNNNVTTRTVNVNVVAALPPDTTAPAVNITAPLPNANITGPFNGASVNVTGLASDAGRGVNRVEVVVDGVSTEAQPRAAGDWATWSATVFLRQPGPRSIIARCTDNAGNQTTSGINVNVSLIPDVSSRLKRLILVESYRLSSYLGSYGAGRIINSFSLLPRETTRINVKTYAKNEVDAKSASSILDSFTQESSDDFEESMGREQSNKKNYDESAQYKLDVTAQASWGWGSAGISGGLSGGTASAREEFSKNISNAVQKHVAKASSKRDVKIETSYEVKTSTSEETSIERKIENINVSRTLNFVFRQMNQEFITLLHLVDVRIGYFKVLQVHGQPNPQYVYREATLPQLDALLEDVIVPEKRAEVRADIIRQLSNIFDYKDRHHRFVEERPLTDRDNKVVPLSQYLRVKKEYTSTYFDEATGSQFTVPGIILAANKSVLRTEGVMAEALVGQGDALDAYSHGLQDEEVKERMLANQAADIGNDKERLAMEIVNSKDAEAARIFAQLYPLPPNQLVLGVPPVSQQVRNGQPVGS